MLQTEHPVLCCAAKLYAFVVPRIMMFNNVSLTGAQANVRPVKCGVTGIARLGRNRSLQTTYKYIFEYRATNFRFNKLKRMIPRLR